MGRFGEWKRKGEMRPNIIFPKIKLKRTTGDGRIKK